MARSYANIVTSVWTDVDFCALSAGAQRTYFMLFSQADISAAGVLALRVRRWSTTIRSNERKSQQKWLDELVQGRYIAIDSDTEELLVRSFIKWDHGYTNRKRLPVIHAAIRDVRSMKLRTVLLLESERLGMDTSASFPQVNTLSDALCDTPSHALSDNASDGVSRSDRVVVKEVGTTPQPSTLEPGTPESGTAHQRSRGTRIKADWAPTVEDMSWAAEKFPEVNAADETEPFRNHFLAKAGRDAIKVDWSLTWRNWIRNSRNFGNRRPDRRGRPVPVLYEAEPGQLAREY